MLEWWPSHVKCYVAMPAIRDHAAGITVFGVTRGLGLGRASAGQHHPPPSPSPPKETRNGVEKTGGARENAEDSEKTEETRRS